MGPLTLALLISGIASAASSLGGAGFNFAAQERANKANVEMNSANNLLQQQLQDKSFAFNAQEAEKQRQWEEQMSNTEVQRRMADMEAAGINPLMAANYGSSVPTGFAASGGSAFTSAGKVQAPHFDMSGFTNAVQSVNNVLLTNMLMSSGKKVVNTYASVPDSKVADFFQDLKKQLS